MNNKFFSKAKRLLSGVIATVMVATILPAIPAMAEDTVDKYPYTLFAASNEEGAITVNAGNFCVNGNVATNGTISSSGNMNINGTKTENANEKMIYILKKLNYAYFTGDNVDIYPDDYSYEDMNININDPMDVKGELELTGNINLNTGIKALEDVTLNGEVKNTNNSVICSETGDIIIDSTNVNLNGLVYAPYGDVEITAQNLNLNNVIIIADTITFNCPSVNANYSSSMAELVGTESDIDVELYAFGEHNSEVNSIDIEWYTNYTNSDYDVLVSDDNVNFTSIATVSDVTTYQYLITEDFETKYFKISLTTNYGEIVESVPFVVTKTDNGYVVDFLDSDGDGLADVYEVSFGTNINNSDTDEDELTDYEEVYLTGTDPTKYDSVTDGISDAEADSDSDVLSNKQEIELGTDPQKADSDKDVLSDYDEINVYGTDPLKTDTDEDGINDGDEIVLSLDPNKHDTDNNGTFDGDEYFEQNVDKSRFDNTLFDNNNAVPSALTVSAKGNVNSNINISEYTGYLKGEERVYVGKVIEISDSEINSGSLTFTLSQNYNVNSYEFGGELTNGLLIFYNDGENTTPLATIYDEKTKTLKADISSEGIYFVLDVMSLENDIIDENLGLTGTGQDVSFMRSTLIQTGILIEKEGSYSLCLLPKDENIANVLTIIQSFFRDTATQGEASFSALYSTLTSPETGIGLKRGVIPIYIAAVLHSMSKDIVLRYKNEEVKITSDLLNSINENPADYSAIMENWNEDKSNYLIKLEKTFKDYIVEREKSYNSFAYIAFSMYRWYMSLPRCSKEMIEEYDTACKIPKEYIRFMSTLKQPTNNARQYLIVDLPKIFKQQAATITTADSILAAKCIFERGKNALTSRIISTTITTFNGNKKATLSSVLKDWCDTIKSSTIQHQFANNENVILSLILTVTNDDVTFANRLAKAITGLRLEDWNSNSIQQFEDTLAKFKLSVEEYNSGTQDITSVSNSCKMIFTNDDGNEITRVFEKSPYSKRAKLLYNDISGAIDEMGQSISEQEKRQVLIDILEKMCK